MFDKKDSMLRLRKVARNRYFFSLKIAALIFATIMLMSCAVGPNFKIPEAPETDSYTETRLPSSIGENKRQGTQKTNRQVRKDSEQTGSSNGKNLGSGDKVQHFVLDKDIPGQWWKVFHSEALNCLIKLGLKNSPTVEAAEAALRQAQETMKAYIGSALLPSVNGQLSAQRQRFSDNSLGISNRQSTIFNLYNASVNVAYTLDVFGGARRGVEALCAQVEYERFTLEAAYLTLTANIVTTAITEASLRAQIQATRDIIRSNEQQLSIVQKQFQLGGVNKTNVLTQETELAQARATLPPLEKSLSATRHLLAVLVGVLPSEANQLPTFHLSDLSLPKNLPVSVPSLLTQQRPDIRASVALLHQASANVGVATAALFPQITLNGNYGNESNTIQDLFKGPSVIWSYSGQLLQPIFQGGSLRAKRRAAIAAFDQANAKYRQTVLQAFQNVADTLRALEFDANTLIAQERAENSARATYALAQQQFKLGAINFQSLLDAERQYQQTRITRIQAEAARYADTAALFQALGGGWWNRGSNNCY